MVWFALFFASVNTRCCCCLNFLILLFVSFETSSSAFFVLSVFFYSRHRLLYSSLISLYYGALLLFFVLLFSFTLIVCRLHNTSYSFYFDSSLTSYHFTYTHIRYYLPYRKMLYICSRNWCCMFWVVYVDFFLLLSDSFLCCVYCLNGYFVPTIKIEWNLIAAMLSMYLSEWLVFSSIFFYVLCFCCPIISRLFGKVVWMFLCCAI